MTDAALSRSCPPAKLSCPHFFKPPAFKSAWTSFPQASLHSRNLLGQQPYRHPPLHTGLVPSAPHTSQSPRIMTLTSPQLAMSPMCVDLADSGRPLGWFHFHANQTTTTFFPAYHPPGGAAPSPTSPSIRGCTWVTIKSIFGSRFLSSRSIIE